MSTLFAFTQYCDDVRKEIDGRPSLVGVYPNNAIMDLDGSKKLPKICAYTIISIPVGQSLESISVTSFWNKVEVEKMAIPDNAIAEFNQKQTQGLQKGQSMMLATVVEIRDLLIGNGGELETKVFVNNAEVELRTLRILSRR